MKGVVCACLLLGMMFQALSWASPLAAEEAAPIVSRETTQLPSASSENLPKRNFHAAIQQLRQEDPPPVEPSISGWALVQGLALCLAVFFVFIHLYRRMHGASVGGKSTRRMQVIERLPIGGKSALLMVEIDGRTRVLAVGSERVTTVDTGDRMRRAAIAEVAPFTRELDRAAAAHGQELK